MLWGDEQENLTMAKVFISLGDGFFIRSLNGRKKVLY